jgi:DNA-binding MarR family transcriptional regulator
MCAPVWNVLHAQSEAGMHGMFFSLKRAFHATLALTRHALGCYGLTAARFDLMYALRKERRQKGLKKALGVSGATLSRMLQSLERLGYVVRRRDPVDGRRKVVEPTEEGRERFEAAWHDLVHKKAVRLAVYCALAASPFGRQQRRIARYVLSALDGYLYRIRWQFRDRATLRYPMLTVPVRVTESLI